MEVAAIGIGNENVKHDGAPDSSAASFNLHGHHTLIWMQRAEATNCDDNGAFVPQRSHSSSIN